MSVYLAMLPRLQAEESMREAERLAFGTGAARSDKRRKILAGWQRDLQGVRPRRSPPIDAKMLRHMSIGVRQVTKHG